MAELRRVAGPSSPLGGRDGRLLAIVVAAIVLAILKPWASSSGPVPSPTPPASARPSPTAQPSAAERVPFDFGVFEGFEPPPAWEIWPAGREFSLGFAMRVNADEGRGTASSPAPTASRRPGASPTARPSPSPSPVASGPVDLAPPTWSGRVAITAGSKLTVVAINMPLGYAIPKAHLQRIDAEGGRVDVPLIRLHSPWPDHFVVLGVNDGRGDALAAWPAGDYVLDLQIAPGGWTRSIRIEVAGTPPASSPSTAPLSGPATGD